VAKEEALLHRHSRESLPAKSSRLTIVECMISGGPRNAGTNGALHGRSLQSVPNQPVAGKMMM
jgi:hypothetical protein